MAKESVTQRFAAPRLERSGSRSSSAGGGGVADKSLKAWRKTDTSAHEFAHPH